MAQDLIINGASPLIGSPITWQVQAAVITGECAFHRVKLTVNCFLDGVDKSETELTLSSPAESGETLTFDISSALRAVADKYEYTAEPPTAYPRIGYSLSAVDEYMQNGEVHDNVGKVVSPDNGTSKYYCIMGGYSDLERILATSGSKTAQHFTRKPTTLPEVVMVGETMVCPQSFSAPISSGNATVGPTSKVVNITTEGLQTINGRQVYALPAGQTDRYQFRFVNGLGCLESISVRSLRTTKVNVTQESFIRSVQETFGSFSRGLVTKKNDYETWTMASGPLDQAWQSWFLHEFLMAKFVWINIDGHWLGCHIIPDEEITGIDRTQGALCEVAFSVQLDLNGSPLSALAL